jgi:hypothetical protein
MVYQINGQLIQKKEIDLSMLDAENNISFDISKYNDGIYFVQLQTESYTKSYKLIIKN